jgi:hypothetical protein
MEAAPVESTAPSDLDELELGGPAASLSCTIIL